ncbi:galactose mutarotase [Marinilongibacter aquaticus]|uniref:aldose epimerase family protein n=1 Tax=Marinilongibacter aquaticus TaxID=2975157 RepID=UPI0021BD61D1|nr:aldose epimerase family protein [Marinilongibacter aquaticus]UBM59062.1 galactose mutarotase [Marinilongibacter aquaticus]
MKKILMCLGFLAAMTACSSSQTEKEKLEFDKESHLKAVDFDTEIDGQKVSLYWIESDSLKAAFTNYGGRLIGLWVPDKNGKMTDVVVGFSSAKGFKNSTEPYFGATIGRVGNRIAKGKFSIDGVEYTIPINNGENTLHGGIKGFQDVVWQAKQIDARTLELRYHSPDMEEGFPGNLDVKVTYSVSGQNTLKMEYEAETDKATPVNLTNHAFFNLNGEGQGTILNHEVKIYADQYTPVDAGLIPLGEQANVEDTPFDFREFHSIGERIDTENEQLKFGGGYDHNFVLNAGEKMHPAATVIGDLSGIQMDIETEEPGLQFYSGNFMASKNTFKSGAKDDYRTAFAMETQHFPDSPNQKSFPSIILNPNAKYETVSTYTFSLQ